MNKKKGKKPVKKAVKKAKKSLKKITSKPIKTGIGMPYSDRVLVKPAQAEEITSFGIIIPDSAKEKPEQGTVVAIGEGRQTNDGKILPMRVKVGDQIMFSKYGYDEIKIQGVEYYLIREESITYIF